MLNVLKNINKKRAEEDLEFTFEVQEMIQNEVKRYLRSVENKKEENKIAAKIETLKIQSDEIEREYYYQLGKGNEMRAAELNEELKKKESRIAFGEMINEFLQD